MSLFHALLLGLVQGLTEFLPISSSAHLVFVQSLLGFKESMIFFDIVLHLGTLVSLFIYFAADLAHLVRDSIYALFFLTRRKQGKEIDELAPHARWALGILIASFPTAVIGFLFKDWFEGLFGSLGAVGLALLGTSAILGLSFYFEKGEKRIEKANWLDFLTIGALQGVAIIPGISRSGTTITAGLFRGLERETAFRFSFLLAIPAILGAALLELKKGFLIPKEDWPALALGFLTAALSGYFALVWLARVTRQGKLHWFAIYTLLLGFAILLISQRIE